MNLMMRLAGCRRSAWGRTLAALLCCALAGPAAAQVAVTTYHNNTQRTGWNNQETALTSAMVAGGGFALLRTLTLDGRMDVQPLVVPGALVTGDPNPGTHDVVYVATENNSVYAIDPTLGTILAQRSLGATAITRGCTSILRAGVLSTPVIDPANNVMFVMARTMQAKQTVYVLHRLSLADLSDTVPPQTVALGGTLSDGSTFTFDATYQRQRTALLLSKGGVLAGFSSYCDQKYTAPRGWLAGWRADTLAPLPAGNAPGAVVSLLVNQNKADLGSFFLSGIWMSGAGLAADAGGNIFAVTGNSDPWVETYNSRSNLAESLIKLAPNSNSVADFFTPAVQFTLDKSDSDFGSGGMMLIPGGAGGLPPHLAVAGGKLGVLTVLNADALGGFAGPGGKDQTVATGRFGSCWCAPSYFESAGQFIVSSGGSTLAVWQLGGPKAPLRQIAAVALPDAGRQGFFTAVSSNGAADPIIWAVPRPLAVSGPVLLQAYRALPAPKSNTLALLFSAPAGVWPNLDNITAMPVVANGHVYVAVDAQLAVFGLPGG